MAVFEIEANGKRYQIEAPDMQSAAAALGSFTEPQGGVSTDSAAVSDFGAKGKAAAVGAADTLSFGTSDELAGAFTAARAPFNDFTMAEGYAAGRDHARGVQDQMREENPVAYGTGQVGGAVIGSLGLAKAAGSLPGAAGEFFAAPATQTVGRMAQGAALGGAEGVAYGFGSGEGAGDRIGQAARYGAIGAGVGAAAPAVVDGARATWDKVVSGPFAAARSAPSATRASRAVNDVVRRSGQSVDDLDAVLAAAAREGQPEYMLADALGRPGQRMLGSLNRSQHDATQEIADYLLTRQTAQPERLAQFTEDAFDLGGTTAKAARDALKSGRDQAADISFGGIRSAGNPVDVRPVVSAIDDKLAPFAQAGVDSPAASVLQRLRQSLAGKSGDATYELSDFSKVFAIRKELADDISAAFRAGRNELGGELRAIKGALDDALAASSDDYAKAMQDFASQSRTMDAVQTGAEMARPGARAADNVSTFGAMNGDQQAAARAGYGDRLLARIEGAAGEGTNRARPLTSPKVQQEAGAIALDPQTYANQVGREGTMHDTFRKVLGGSETAERLADDSVLDSQTMGVIANALRGNFGQAAAQAGMKAGNTLMGRNTATRAEIARMLLSRDPKKAVELALRKESTGASRAMIADALLRALQRPGLPALEN